MVTQEYVNTNFTAASLFAKPLAAFSKSAFLGVNWRQELSQAASRIGRLGALGGLGAAGFPRRPQGRRLFGGRPDGPPKPRPHPSRLLAAIARAQAGADPQEAGIYEKPAFCR